jgi:hypothetical protein
MRAFYNLTNNRLFLWPDMPKGTKLPADQYTKVKANHMQWWPRGCFTCLWSPEAEDFLVELVGEVKEDDTPDDIERRVDRYSGYAESSEVQAEQASERILSGRAHTKRQLSQAENTSTSAAEKAEHWHRRIAGAIARANQHDRPDVIVRRIEGLEKDVRHWQGYTNLTTMRFKSDPDKIYYFAGKGRGAHQIDEDEIPAAQAHASRWLNHLNMRLEYERGYLEAVGGDPRKQVEDIKVGDVVMYAKEECEVVAVGKKNVRIVVPSHHWNKGGRMVKREDLGEIVKRGNGKSKPKVKVDDGIKVGVKVSFKTGSETNTGTVTKASPKNCLVSTENLGQWINDNYHNAYPIRRSRLTIVEA